MSQALVVAAGSGMGKSTSIGKISSLEHEGLDPQETVLINVMGKPLPFKEGREGYKKAIMEFNQITGKFEIKVKGNLLESKNAREIIDFLYIINQVPRVKNVIIDDFQYIMADEFMATASVKGFDKFNKIAANAYYVMLTGLQLRDDIVFIVLTHSEPVQDGNVIVDYKIKTIGKMLDDKVTLEGLYSIILFGDVVKDVDGNLKKVFFTNSTDKFRQAKSPIGMFEDTIIKNDLGYVVKQVRDYYK